MASAQFLLLAASLLDEVDGGYGKLMFSSLADASFGRAAIQAARCLWADAALGAAVGGQARGSVAQSLHVS